MKNPFIAIAAAMGVALAKTQQLAHARFYSAQKPSRSRRRFRAGPSGTGSKLARKAAEHRLGTFRGAVVTNLR